MATDEETNDKTLGRRKFMRFGMSFLGGVGLISALGGITKLGKTSNPKMVKMLTPDGKLVEIDAALLKKAENAPRASNEDVQKWMLKKHNS